MAQQRQQRSGGGGVVRLAALLLLALALLSPCLSRADAVAAPSAPLASAAAASDSEHGVATARENALAQGGDVEWIQDYGGPSANTRHVPHP